MNNREHCLYVIWDCKTESFFGTPFFREHREDARREWSECANDVENKQNKIAKYPGDYTLFEVGKWNPLTGEFTIYDAKYSIGSALEYVRTKENN